VAVEAPQITIAISYQTQTPRVGFLPTLKTLSPQKSILDHSVVGYDIPKKEKD